MGQILILLKNKPLRKKKREIKNSVRVQFQSEKNFDEEWDGINFFQLI